MKIQIEIPEEKINKQIKIAVREHLEKTSLLPYLREEVKNMYASCKYKDLSNEIRKLKAEVTRLKKRDDKDNRRN